MRLNQTIAIVLLSALLGVFQNCTKHELAPLKAVKTAADLQPFQSTAYKIKPALAVRAPACIGCHVTVHGDWVTDFGNQDPFFFGRGIQRLLNEPVDTKALWSKSFYGGFYGSLTDPGSTGLVEGGHFIVPRTTLSQKYEGSTASLKDFLLSNGLDKNLSQVIQERDEVYIGAPTEADIRNLVPLFNAEEVPVSPYFHALWTTPNTTMNGIILKFSANSRSNYFLTNEATLDCAGDVIIDGPVFLNNLKLNTNPGGCRIYATGTIFVQGAPQYVGPYAGKGANLQLSSARGIFMGMSTMSERFQYLFGLRNANTPESQAQFYQNILNDRDIVVGLTDDSGYYQTRTQADGKVIGYMKDMDKGGVWYPAPGFTADQVNNCTSCVDSGLTYSSGGQMINSKSGQPIGLGSNLEQTPSAPVIMTGMVLNAPVVMSRYIGEFRGSIIAEFVLFRLDVFNFYGDDQLSTVPILPLVNDRIYKVSDQ